MNIQPAQQVPANIAQSDQSLCLCHDTLDCPEQATVEINANQLARIAELLDVLDGFLRHANGITTRYAHLRGFARGIRAGARVTQGDVIGYVGSTGLSTGAHLHYEINANNKQINPLQLLNQPTR